MLAALESQSVPVGEEINATIEMKVYGHSTLFYWWPAWFFGLICALVSAWDDAFVNSSDKYLSGSALGLSYVVLLLLLIFFTNVKLRGIYSVVLLLGIAFVSVTMALFGWWDELAKIMPYLSVRVNTGFYMVFSTGLLLLWLAMFFIFDRMTYWRIRPGQLTVEHRIGGGAESFDTGTLRFQKLTSDLFRAGLGLGSGDLSAVSGTSGTGPASSHLQMPNVLFVSHKIRLIERLIVVKPDVAGV
jgi:hypothetical protein